MTTRPPRLPDFARLLGDLSAQAAGVKTALSEIKSESPPQAPTGRRLASWLRQMLRRTRRRIAQLFRPGARP